MTKKMINQMIENEQVNHINEQMDSLSADYRPVCYRRLNTCQAHTFGLANFVILVSYETEVACIDGRTGICYDYLRKYSSYTATSAQHIAKFMKQYGAIKKVTYRPI